MLNQNTQIHKNIHSISDYSIVVLLFGLVLWIVVPILGIFPLLVAIQLNLLKPNAQKQKIALLNNLVLILIVLTLSIFSSSYSIWSDTEVLVKDYQRLGELTPFEYSYGNGLEFVTLLLAYPVYYLTNGSTYAFLFSHSLIINSLMVFVVSKGLSKRYYPILLILVFSTTTYYYYIFLIRHSLSNVFLLAAIVSLYSSRFKFLLYLFLSLFSHLSNLIYCLILLLIRIESEGKFLTFYIQKKRKALIFITIGLILFFFAGLRTVGIPIIIQQFSSILQQLGIVQVSDYLYQKTADYNFYKSDGSSLTFSFILNFFLIGISVILSAKKFPKISAITFSLELLFFVLLGLFTLNISWRLFYFLSSLYGIFYSILMEINMRIVKWVVPLAIAINFSVFLRSITGLYFLGDEHTFFQGNILGMNFFDYLEFLINATPNYN